MLDRMLTYAGLESAANRFARSMHRHGVGRGATVALWMPKSIEAVVAIWGILKAGAIYIPIDPAAPALRMAAIARDCRIAGLVTIGARAAEVERAFGESQQIRALWYADDGPDLRGCPTVAWRNVLSESDAATGVDVNAEELASVVYTSGSTGRPKGVMVSHRAILWQSGWLAERAELTMQDRIAGLTPLHSSMSTFDLCGAAQAGAALYPVDHRLIAFPSQLGRFIAEQGVTICLTVPTMLVELARRGNLAALDLSALRMLIACGEALAAGPVRELRRMLPATRFVHGYGRTEAKIFTWHEIASLPQDDAARLQMGRPAPDCAAYVLDEAGRPLPAGVTGELWVSGPNLMTGYWGMPNATAEAMRTIEPAFGVRILACRTGDRVTQRADGNLEFVGRVDQQVKVRGFRVELGEIEAVLTRHPAVAQAAVLAVPDEAGARRLVAAVMLKDGMSADGRELRRHCAALLPPHAVPEEIEPRDNLPLTSTGKLDRRAAAPRAGEPAE
jgi:amino acid adenylation domain-containing protein